jgi:hypothetical protein
MSPRETKKVKSVSVDEIDPAFSRYSLFYIHTRNSSVMVKTKKYDSGGEKLKSLISEEIKFSKLN